MFNSLRSKILLSLSGLVFCSTLLIMFLVHEKTNSQISHLQNESAQNLVTTVALSIENQYNHLLENRKLLLEEKKKELKDLLQIARESIQAQIEEWRKGKISEEEAKVRVQNIIRRMRHSDGEGYFWINDTGSPYPRMIMHPILPELEGRVLDDALYKSVMGTGQHFFLAIKEAATKPGGGYVEYRWPKQTKDGLKENREKISYVSLIPEWNWILGTGVYIDDLDAEVNRRLGFIISEITEYFAAVRVGESGYMYLFTGDKDMLIHPTLAGQNLADLINPTTGNPILDDLEVAAKSPDRILEYIWDKPDQKGVYRFWKKSHLMYFEPLDWYIGSTVYTDEIEAPAKDLTQYILFLALVILVISFFLSLLLANSLTRPLHLLTSAAKKIQYDQLDKAVVPVTGSEETKNLGTILNKMLDSFRQAVQTKEELFVAKLELESRLYKVEKMESVGRLAAGIAHEINTPAQYVSTNLHFIQDAYEDLDELITQVNERLLKAKEAGEIQEKVAGEVEELLETADWEYLQEELPQALTQSRDGLSRISKIVSAMKNFSHPGNGTLEDADINQGIQNTVTVARNEWKYAAEMDFQLDDNLPLVPCYIDELNQVILNMIINGAHSIADKNAASKEQKGKIVIQTKVSGKFAQISIGDTGMGMHKDVVEKIFDPFYTTKEVGKGSGQGLAIAHDIIVNKHGGTIEVDSTPGMGTTFTINLPLGGEEISP